MPLKPFLPSSAEHLMFFSAQRSMFFFAEPSTEQSRALDVHKMFDVARRSREELSK